MEYCNICLMLSEGKRLVTVWWLVTLSKKRQNALDIMNFIMNFSLNSVNLWFISTRQLKYIYVTLYHGPCIVFKWNTATLAWGSFLMARSCDWWHRKSENVNLWYVDDIILKDRVETPYSLSQIKTHHSCPTFRYTQEPRSTRVCANQQKCKNCRSLPCI